ncbi:MAG: helix-turn-helix transcriptional regulator [Bacteroidales bacterium]|nr:helix-turn-helix transcriptional regulator [Bacteroidales bacterium]
MYEQYLKYNHIPCGAVIDRIRIKKHLSQRELAERSNIIYQRINDFITGRRKISPEQSLLLERALGIEIQCFFYQVQSNHEIYTAINRIAQSAHPDLSKYRKALFWDTTFDTIEWQRNAAWVIRRVFEYGNAKEIRETIRYYGRERIRGTLAALQDHWNEEIRTQNLTKYLNDDIKN